LAAAQAHLGRVQEARDSVHALHALRPDVDYEFIRNYWPIADAKAVDYLMDGLEKAGLRPNP
jgi:hypothetical protein